MEENKIIKLSPHFTLTELSRQCPNPPAFVQTNLSHVANHILEPLREQWGGPITINSGYRTPEHNREVGGSPTSLHTQGLAVDIKCPTFTVLMSYVAIIIAERISFNELYPSFKTSTGTWWLHVSTYKQPYLNAMKIRFDMNGKIYK